MGDQNITPIITCCQKALAVSHSPHLREIKIGIKCKAMTRSPLIHIPQNNNIIPIVFNRVKWVDLVQGFVLAPENWKKKKLHLCGKSNTTSRIYFNLNMEINIHIPFCWFEIKKSVHSVWKDISIRQTSLKKQWHLGCIWLIIFRIRIQNK